MDPNVAAAGVCLLAALPLLVMLAQSPRARLFGWRAAKLAPLLVHEVFWWASMVPTGIRIHLAYSYASWRRFRGVLHKDIAYGRHARQTLDVYAPDVSRGETVVFVHGGAWGSGNKKSYVLLAQNLARLGYVVVVPNYRIFPHATVPGQVDDIRNIVGWARDGLGPMGGDADNVVLVGHSAGAHLLAMAVLHERMETAGGRATTHEFEWLRRNMAGVAHVRAVVSLSGVFDIDEHYVWESLRGVEYLSTMEPAMDGRANFAALSPTKVMRRHASEHEDDFALWPTFHVLHGTADGTVPSRSSADFVDELRAADVRVTYDEMAGVGHSEVVLAMMAPGPPWNAITQRVIDVIERAFDAQ